nr:hypothetical protein GCM10020093_026120 [Planobispora longispora]
MAGERPGPGLPHARAGAGRGGGPAGRGRAGGGGRAAGGRQARGARGAGEELEETLRRRGYEPYEEEGRLRLRNCPFHVLAEQHPLLVCSMNLSLCQGLLEGLGQDPARARLDPRPGSAA